MWTDPDFDVVSAAKSIREVKSDSTIVALPISYLYPGATCAISNEKSNLSIDHFDVLQSGYGNCWLLSAMCTVAHSTSTIDDIIVFNDDVRGITVFSLLGNYICVDHFVPVLIKHDGSSEIIAPKVSKENESWPILLEKCIIKIMGSRICPNEIRKFNLTRRYSMGVRPTGPQYIDINGGFPRWALGILFNFHFQPIQTKLVGDLISIFQCAENEKLVGCACTSVEKSDNFVDAGFVYGHCYAILRVDPVKKLIRVRNPWGTVESTKYDDEGVLNGQKREDDGEFFVDIDDFRERFPLVVFAKIITSSR